MMDVVTMTVVSAIKSEAKRKLAVTISKTSQLIETCLGSDDLRLEDNAFTRKRRLGAQKTLRIILHRIYCSLQLCLDKYFDEIGEIPVSKQAFSKARRNLNPEYVRKFADASSEAAAEDATMPDYKGMRLIAIDGSDVALENTKELKDEFGCSGPKKNSATALSSIAFGPLDHVIYDCRIDRYDTDERTLAKAHVGRLTELGLKGSLLLFDRGYPSADFIASLYESGYPFVMRVRRKFNIEVDNIKTQGWINLYHNDKAYPVRVLKIKLPSGEIETLLTSLHQKQLPISQAGELYFNRWGVETAYDIIKSKLELENFSGKTKVSVFQDFYATIYLANLAAFANEEADELISAADSGKNMKYHRKSNCNRTISRLRAVFLSLIMEPDASMRNDMLDKLVLYISRYPVPVVPDRSPPRKSPRNKRFFQNRRSVVG